MQKADSHLSMLAKKAGENAYNELKKIAAKGAKNKHTWLDLISCKKLACQVANIEYQHKH